MIIVGGGLSGLATGFWLKRERPGSAVTVLEAGVSAGGNVDSTIADGFTIERGPNSLRPGAPDTAALIEALGLTGEIVPAAATASRRYLVSRGKLVPVPGSPRSALATPLLSPAGKLRALAEPFIAKGRQPDESVASFLSRRFGREVAERLGGPMVGGLVAGDPERLSVAALFPQLVALERRHGSVLRGLVASRPGAARPVAGEPAAREVVAGEPAAREPVGGAPAAREPAARRGGPYTFRGGMGRLSAALAAGLGPALRTRAEVRALRRSETGYELELSDGARLRSRNVVLATPARVSAALLRELAPAAAAELGGIASAGVVVATLAYPGASFPVVPEGFGFLAPRGQGVRALGVQFASSTFPLQAPAGTVLLRAIAGGTTDPGFLELAESEALVAVRRDLESTLGVTGAPLVQHYSRLPAAIPQYEVGHEARVARIDSELAGLPGLRLVGHAVRGVGVNDCLRAARALAKGLIENAGTWDEPAAEPAHGVAVSFAGPPVSN